MLTLLTAQLGAGTTAHVIAGATARMRSAEATTTLVAAVPPNVTVAPSAKPLPVMVTPPQPMPGPVPREHGVRHPYVEAGLDKATVRSLARALGLGSVAELPAAPCLSSRVETGIAIEPEFRRTIERQAQREHRSMSCFIRAVLAERVATAHEAGAAG
mgnify:CR=1 FL=1